MNNIFRGVGVALVTPFTPNASIDFEALDRLVSYHLDGGVDYICMLGSTAESACLSDEEKLEVKRFVIAKVAGRCPLLLGFGGNDTHRLLEEARHFDFTGIDGILSVAPYYNRPSQEGVFQHFKALANEVKIPVVLYNVPSRTGLNMSAATTVRLARECDNIVAIKEASGDISQIAAILTDKPEHFDFLSGDDALALRLIGMGAKGVVSVIANALPKLFTEMVHHALDGHNDIATELNARLAPVYPLLSVDGNPSGIKAMLSNMGLCQNILRLPLTPASPETIAALRTAWVGKA